MFSSEPIGRQQALSIYCNPAARLAYDQWISYPMRNLFEDQYGTSVTSVVTAVATGYVERGLFPLGKFDIRVVAPNASEDDAFFVTVDPGADNWQAMLSEQLTRVTGIPYATLVDSHGGPIDMTDASMLIDNYTQLFTVVPGREETRQVEEQIGVKITSSMNTEEQMFFYAKALAKRVYETNNVKELRRFVTDRTAALELAVAVAKHKGLDAVLAASFGGRRSEFYARVATYIRSNVRTAVGVLEYSKSPVENLRRSFIEEFLDVSFQGWIESSLAGVPSPSDSESSSDEEFSIGENIDCEYDSYSDIVDSEDDATEQTSLGAKFSKLKKAAKNLAKRGQYVSFKLRRRSQDDVAKDFSWLGTTALEPGDIIHTIVHAAKEKKSPLLKRKKNKKPKELPTSVIVDFQMRNRRERSSAWLTVQTVEVLLPESGKIDGPLFAVPLDDQAFRIVTSVRRPGEGWHMTDEAGVYEFTVDTYGTRDASRRNYPVTWEQVRVVRYNPELRAKYSIPEFVFHARLVDSEPKPYKRKLTGEIVDYFGPEDQQKMEDERQRSLQNQREEGVQAYFDKMRQRVEFKSYAIAEVRHVIWALNNNMSYASDYLRDALQYDDEYTAAMQSSIDARLTGSAAVRRYQRQNDIGRRSVVDEEEEEESIDAMVPVWMPPEPRRSGEMTEDEVVRFGAGLRYAAPNAGRNISVSEFARQPPRANPPRTRTRARIAPAPVIVAQQPAPAPAVVQPPLPVVVGPTAQQLQQANAQNTTNGNTIARHMQISSFIDKYTVIFEPSTVATAKALRKLIKNLSVLNQVSSFADVAAVQQTATALADPNVANAIGAFYSAIDADIAAIKANADALTNATKAKFTQDSVKRILNRNLGELNTAADKALRDLDEANIRALATAKQNLEAYAANPIPAKSNSASSAATSAPQTPVASATSADNARRIAKLEEMIAVVNTTNVFGANTKAAGAAIANLIGRLPKVSKGAKAKDAAKIAKNITDALDGKEFTDAITLLMDSAGIDLNNRINDATDEVDNLPDNLPNIDDIKALAAALKTAAEALKLDLDNTYADAYNKANAEYEAAIKAVTPAPSSSATTSVTERISIDALFEELNEEQMGVGDSIVEETINYVVMAGDAVRHTFDRAISVVIKTMNPRYFGSIFGVGRQYIIVVPDNEVWQRYFVAINRGQTDYASFLRDYTFEVLPGGLFSHSRYVVLTSLSGRNTVEVKRNYDKERNVTTVKLRAADGYNYTGTLDTHAYSSDYKIHSVKMSGWTGFSS